MRITVSRVIERPPRDVFRFVATDHFVNHPRWDDSIIEIVPLTPEPVKAGSRARVRRRRGADDEILEVLTYEPNRRWRSRDDIGPFVLTMTALVEAAGAASSRLTLEADVEAIGMARAAAPLLKPVFRRRMRHSAARIKAMIESGPARVGHGAGS
jgi:Polyketide cyclase / dehydrase and lipid transport